jgi:hypothetical protein
MPFLSSPPSVSLSIVGSIGSWWLKDPLNSANNLMVNAHPGKKTSTTEGVSVHRALGRIKPLVLADVVRGEDGDIDFWTATAADYANLRGLLMAQRTLLLVDPHGLQWYVRIISARDVDRPFGGGDTVNIYRVITAQYVEVDTPLVTG